MSDDLISRQGAIAYTVSGLTREIDGENWIRVSEVRENIKTMPTADVVERKKGKWESTRPDAPMFGFYFCSLCGRKRTSPQDRYCPNCGAEMESE